MASRRVSSEDSGSSSVDVGPGDFSNLSDVMRVMEAAFPKTYGESWNHHQCRSMLAMPSAKLLIAQKENSVCGFVISRQAADEEELLMIAVSPECQKLGVGYMLLEKMFLDAREDNVSAVFLEMRANNPAGKLYARFGFQEIGLRKAYYTGPNMEKFDAITYKAPISGQLKGK